MVTVTTVAERIVKTIPDFRREAFMNISRSVRVFAILLALLQSSLYIEGLAQNSRALPNQPRTIQVARGQGKSPTVYITRTGKKYHRDSCTSLRSSRFPIESSLNT
jgi:hypothetical protein